MPMQRARKYHQDRVAETLRDEISTMIEGELSDPRITFAYVSEVVLNPGSKSARVYITVDGSEDDQRETLEALIAAQGYIRHTIKQRMGVRFVPELSFHIDKSENLKMRIDELLGRMNKRAKTSEAPAAAPAEASPKEPAPK